jgi:phospholipid/cholesterol/gamma-HCH transport system substrate-binding protein
MTISKEVRIGLLVTVAVVLFFIGFYFLKGANLFLQHLQLLLRLSDVDGLQNSANVQVNGLNVGHDPYEPDRRSANKGGNKY